MTCLVLKLHLKKVRTRYQFITVKTPTSICKIEVNFLIQEIHWFPSDMNRISLFHMHNCCSTNFSSGSHRTVIFYVISYVCSCHILCKQAENYRNIFLSKKHYQWSPYSSMQLRQENFLIVANNQVLQMLVLLKKGFLVCCIYALLHISQIGKKICLAKRFKYRGVGVNTNRKLPTTLLVDLLKLNSTRIFRITKGKKRNQTPQTTVITKFCLLLYMQFSSLYN